MVVDGELRNALNNGGGIALVYSLTECPDCKDDIWVEIGHHCGFDAVLECVIEAECYKCLNNVKFDFNDVSIQKDIRFRAASELSDVQLKNKRKYENKGRNIRQQI